ncbi:MAG: ATP-binding cassette domain-containing protein [Chitinophagaceae bacterium]
MLQISNYKKSYGKKTILTIDECILDRGIYWLQGVNGSGKSTLLKSTAGILSFDGSIVWNGLDVVKDGLAYRSKVNFGDAEPLFPDFLTGNELVQMFLEAKKAPIGQEKSLIADLQMQSYLDAPVATYSSGMLKKLSLLLAFLGNPELILLDEPFITIDAATLEVVYGWIAKSWRDNNISFLLSSHQTIEPTIFPELRKLQIIDKKLFHC